MATIADVARESGFSIATVSNVLNGGPKPVRADTKQRVIGAATRLNYHPNAMAQGLVRRRSKTLGVYFYVVKTDVVVSNPYAGGILQGILKATAETGYNLTFFTRPWRNAEMSAPAFRDGRSDGILIVAPTMNTDIVSGLADLGLTLVTISTTGAQGGVPSIDIDDAIGTRIAVQHLLDLGHKRIAHLCGDDDMLSAAIRKAEFVQTMADAGVETRPEYIVPCAYSGVAACPATQRLLEMPEPPTAIFAANDDIAINAMAAIRNAGLSVPDDISVIGFDDSPVAAVVHPALTTVHQPFVQMGEQAAHLLIAQIENRPVPPISTIEPKLVIRESTGPVKQQ